MRAILRLLDPLRNAASAFFRHDVALRREPDGVRIVLEERPADPARAKPTSRSQQAARKEQDELALMKTQLAALLDDMPETRQTMRHLVFVEHALHKKGLRALHKLPLDVLQRALEQLEGLVTNWSPTGLASLRSKMAVAIIDREHMGPEADGDAQNTAAVLDASLLEPPPVPEVSTLAESEDDALAAAYAALSTMAPAAVESEPEPASAASEPGLEDAELAAAYAALGAIAPSEVEFQAELGSKSARAMAQPLPRASEPAVDINLRELQH